MSVFKQIKTYITQKTEGSKAPEGFCPNCWGRQEYEGKFFDALYQEKIDLNNINEKKGWIEAYAIKHLEGIQLKRTEDEALVCPNCKVAYRPNA